MFLAGVASALGIGLYAFLFWLGVGDILLKFALEDGSFFEVATGCHALDIFEDTEPSLPQPRTRSAVPENDESRDSVAWLKTGFASLRLGDFPLGPGLILV